MNGVGKVPMKDIVLMHRHVDTPPHMQRSMVYRVSQNYPDILFTGIKPSKIKLHYFYLFSMIAKDIGKEMCKENLQWEQ